MARELRKYEVSFRIQLTVLERTPQRAESRAREIVVRQGLTPLAGSVVNELQMAAVPVLERSPDQLERPNQLTLVEQEDE